MNRHDAYPSEMVIIIFEELSISFCSHRKETTLNSRRLLKSTIVDKLGKTDKLAQAGALSYSISIW